MSKKKNRRPLILIVGFLVFLGLIFGLKYFTGKDKDTVKVSVSKVEKRTIKEQVSASGKVYPATEVKITSDVSGEVIELYVEEGDSVKSGQLLAKVNPDVYQSAVERSAAILSGAKAQAANAKAGIERNRAQLLGAKAEVTRFEAQLKNTNAIHKRNITLKEQGIISEAEFDASLSALDALKANMQAAQASLESAGANLKAAEETHKASNFTVASNQASLKEMRSNLKRTTIYAPVEGVVSSLSIEQGERVVGTAQMAGTEMMRIANLNIMEVQVEVSENDVLKVAMADKVSIEVDAYLDKTFEGQVTHIANSAVNAGSSSSLTTDQVTNFIVKVLIDADSYASLVTDANQFPFRPGMSASVEINTDSRDDVLSVPIQAVSTRLPEKEKGEGSSNSNADPIEVVFVSSLDSVNQVKVKTGIQDDDYIQILSGLEGEEEIIAAPYSAISKDLKQGAKIKVVDEEELYGSKEGN
ncbi:MAG: HlyD family efflux transporter periplasmic adaptor subunit [Saprospiraceae bacterium]|nr:HlyD family efflux transporter periplasmic adaptor subunit [Saprospiraceae bacterium]